MQGLMLPTHDYCLAPIPLQPEVLAEVMPQAATLRPRPTAEVVCCEPPQPTITAMPPFTLRQIQCAGVYGGGVRME